MSDIKLTLEDVIIKQVEQLAGEHFPGTDDTAVTMRKVWIKRFFNNLAVGNAHPEFFPDENYPAGAPRRTQHFIAWDLPRLMIEWTALSRHLFNTSAQDCAKKVVHEAKELLKESQTPWIYDGDREHGIMEMVDVMMALLSTMDRSNVSLDEFTAAFKIKMEINRNREWIQNQDGTYSHKKEDPATERTETKLFCTNCGKRLDPKSIVWMELSVNDGAYYENGIPDGHVSQGWFEFGADCANKIKNNQF